MGQVRLGLMHEILGTSPIAPLAFGNAAPDSGNSEILALAGTTEQKDRWLHPLLAGDLRSAFSMTEPRHARLGPDAARRRARCATATSWVIDGHKWFSSNGSIADFLIVMAVTDPDARAVPARVDVHRPGRHAGRGDRARRRRRWSTRGSTSARYGGHAEILYDGRPRAGARRCSAARARASASPSTGSCPGRIHHCMRWLGVARRAFDMMCERAHLPPRARVAARREADRAELDRRLRRRDAGRAADDAARRLGDGHRRARSAARTDVALIKFFGAKVLHDVVDRALQVHGVARLLHRPAARGMYRFARAARIYDGPDEVHRQSVARQVLLGYAPPADGVPTEHVPTRRAQARERFGDLLEAVTAND